MFAFTSSHSFTFTSSVLFECYFWMVSNFSVAGTCYFSMVWTSILSLRLELRRVSYRSFRRHKTRLSWLMSRWRKNHTNLLCVTFACVEQKERVGWEHKRARSSCLFWKKNAWLWSKENKGLKKSRTYLSYRYRDPSRIGDSSIVRPAWM